MGCVNSNSVVNENIDNVVNENQWVDDKLVVKSSLSIKSKKSLFSKKGTKILKINNKPTLVQDRIQQDQIKIEDKLNQTIPNVKIFQISKRKLKQIRKKIITSQEIIQLNNQLSRHQFFFKLTKQQKTTFIESLKLYQIKKGKFLFQKGQLSQNIYIVKEGQLELQTFNKEFPFIPLQRYDFVGQIDSIFGINRTHSVLAKQKTKIWQIEKQKFDQIKEEISQQNLSVVKTYLQKVSIFSYLPQEEISLLCSKTFIFKFRSNQLIFRKGDSSDKIFILISGQVLIQIPNKNNLIIKSGEIFGEGCLKPNPQSRAGTAISHKQCRCLVISRKDLFECLGDDNVQNITNFSLLKWAFKRSPDFKDEQTKSLYKIIQKGKTKFFKDDENIFQNEQNFPNYYLISLQGKVNEYNAGVLVNCFQQQTKNYIKKGQGNVFLFQIKKFKKGNTFSKPQKIKIKRQSITPLKKADKLQVFGFQNLQSFMKDLILVKKQRSLQGGKGDIYNVFNKSAGRFYNIRCLKKFQVNQNEISQEIINQKNILSKAKECSFLNNIHKTFNDNEHIYFVFKGYANGSLQQLIGRHRQFDREEIMHLLSCMIIGIQYMHSQMKIVHRNIALQNIFLDQMGYFCIDNFQNSKQLNQKDPKTHTIIGTPQYFAPQMISGNGYSYEVDYWALGVIAYRLVFGKFPFINSNNDPFDIFRHVIKNKPEFKSKSQIDPHLIQLIRMLLFSNPKNRVPQNTKGIRSHPFFEEIDWDELQKRITQSPFNIAKFINPNSDKKYQESKNYFSNFISKEKKKIQQNTQRNQQNFKTWDFHFI